MRRVGGARFSASGPAGGTPIAAPVRRLEQASSKRKSYETVRGTRGACRDSAAGLAVAGQGGFSLAGRVSATDQEAQEGYFAIDQQTMIVVKPKSALHNYLKGKVGQRVRITVEPSTESE